MKTERFFLKIMLGLLVMMLLGMSTLIATANNDEVDDDAFDVAIAGNALIQASNAVLQHMGEGQITETEVGDEDAYYEVEVTLDNGHEVDVHLDEHFNILSTEFEDEEVED